MITIQITHAANKNSGSPTPPLPLVLCISYFPGHLCWA